MTPRPADVSHLDVLHVAHSTDRRGAEVFAATMAEALRARGARSEAVALVPGSTGGLALPTLGSHGRTPAAVLRLHRMASGRDALVLYGASTLHAGAAASRGGPPAIYRTIGDPRFWGRVRARRVRIGLPLRSMERVVALWPASAAALVEMYDLSEERVRTIPNGRDPDRYRPAQDGERSAARARLGLPADGPVVAYVGSLAWEKRPLVALDVVRRLPEVTLLLAGDGAQRPEVEAAAAALGARARVLGAVRDVREIYQAADALILPSRTEGMPGVVIEAGLSGVPSVATDVGGTSELVDETTGALVPPDQEGLVEALADATARVLDDAPARGRAALARCREGFTTEVVLAQWVDLIAEVADGAAGRTRRARPRTPSTASPTHRGAVHDAPAPVSSLHLIASTDRRGAELFASDLAQALREGGDEASVAAVRTGTIAPVGDIAVLGRHRFDPAAWRALRAAAEPDLPVVAHGAETLHVAVAALAGRDRPWVYRTIGDPTYWGRVPAADVRIGALLRRAPLVVALWPGAADELVLRYRIERRRVEVITNAVVAGSFPLVDDAERAEHRAALGLGDGPVLAHVGALSHEKDPLRAVAVVAEVPGAHLVIAGDGPLRPQVEALAAATAPGRVHLLGSVDAPHDVIGAADCLLLTSRTEGVPAVAIEAGLIGIPVAAPDVGGIHRVVVDGETGRLSDDRSVGALAEAVRWCVDHRDDLGRAGRARCEAHFTMDVVAPAWRALLDDVCAGRRGRAGRR